MERFDLSDEEWKVIEPLLPINGRGPKRKDDRNILNAIFYILRTGAPWRDLPERYGPYTTVFAIIDGVSVASGRVFLMRLQMNVKIASSS